MATKIPTTMRAIALTKFCNPAEYNVGTLPVPKITRPDELLIRVRAASVNPVDVKLASSYVFPIASLEDVMTDLIDYQDREDDGWWEVCSNFLSFAPSSTG